MRKLKLLLAVLALAFIMVPTNAKAAADVTNADGVTITNITSSSAVAYWGDWTTAELKNYASVYGDPDSPNLTLKLSAGGRENVQEGYEKVGINLKPLSPGVEYMLELYLYPSTTCAENDYIAYTYITFTTDSTAATPSTPTGGQDQQPQKVVLKAPKVKTAEIGKTDAGTINMVVNAADIDGNANKVEWKVVDAKNGNKVVRTEMTQTVGTVLSNFGRKIYGVQCRAVYDDGYGQVSYSSWSPMKYAIAQPKFKSKKKDIKRGSITVRYAKIKGAKSYTIYMRKNGKSKWNKIKTTKKTSYKVTKMKGKKLYVDLSGYDVMVIANASVGGQSIKSKKIEYTNCYVKTRYIYK